MPDYKYQGTSRSGGSVSGVMTASNKAELANLLKRQQITATKMTEKGKEFNMPTFGGRRECQGTRDLHAPVLGHDRRRSFRSGPSVSKFWRPAREQVRKSVENLRRSCHRRESVAPPSTGTRPDQDLLKELVLLLPARNFEDTGRAEDRRRS